MKRDEVYAFLRQNHQAVMVTLGRTGQPHAVPVLGALEGDRFWISGTDDRVRTRHVERDPRCTVVVFESGTWFRWVTIEGTCEIRSEDRVGDNLRLYESITGRKPDDLDEYAEAMVRERRLVYAISIDRWYP